MSKMLEIRTEEVNSQIESRRSVRLGDICFPRNESISPAEFPESIYVGLEHLDSGDPRLNRWGKAGEVSSSKSQFYSNDILYGKLRPYLDKAALAEFDGICSTDILVIVSNSTLLASEYLSMLLHSRSFIDYAVKITQGVNLPRASWSLLTDFEFYLPPLPEQRAIARVLRAVQDAIQARRRELALERERKAALMQHLFTYGTRGEATKQTEIGEMPAGWEIRRLEDVCAFTTGKRNSEDADVNGKYPFFTCSQETSSINSYAFDQEALLLAGNNAQGNYSVKYYNGKFDAYQRTYVITISNQKCFLYKFLLCELSRKLTFLKSNSLGATTRYLTAPIINNILLAQPAIQEQMKIASLIMAVDTKIDRMLKETQLLEELFRALLEELMTGRLSATALITADDAQGGGAGG